MRSWLYKIRQDKRMTHMDVAQKAKIHRAYYTMIENGTRNPSVIVAKKIAKVLGFGWTTFYSDQSDETAQETNII